MSTNKFHKIAWKKSFDFNITNNEKDFLKEILKKINKTLKINFKSKN
jgi:hypothetical protein